MIEKVFINKVTISTLALGRILQNAGVEVHYFNDINKSPHHISIQDSTLSIIDSLWNGVKQSLKQSTQHLTYKLVGSKDSFIEVEESTTIVAYDQLLKLIFQHSKIGAQNDYDLNNHDVEINVDFQSGISSGTRMLSSFKGAINSEFKGFSIFETLPESWVYGFPINNDFGVIQIMHLPNFILDVPTLRSFLSKSILKEYFHFDSLQLKRSFPAFPRLSSMIASKKNFSLGGGLIRYDPLCGDGTGMAIKSAILLAGVLCNKDTFQLIPFYQSKLSQNYVDHLESCINFYSKFESQTWENEMQLMHADFNFLKQNVISKDFLSYSINFFNGIASIERI